VKLTLVLLLVVQLSNFAKAEIFRHRNKTAFAGMIDRGGDEHFIRKPFNGVVVLAAAAPENPAPATNPVHVRKLPQTPEEMDALLRDLQGPRMFVYYGGLALMFIGGLWFLIRTFQQSIWWGLGCLLCGLPSLFFLFFHWQKARDPFLMQLAGIVLMLGAVFVMN